MIVPWVLQADRRSTVIVIATCIKWDPPGKENLTIDEIKITPYSLSGHLCFPRHISSKHMNALDVFQVFLYLIIIYLQSLLFFI